MERKYECPETNGEGKVEEPSAAISYGEQGSVFNPVQQHLLKMFAYDGSEERLEEVRRVLAEHFGNLMDKRLDELWEDGTLNQKKLDEFRNVDLRKL